MYYAYATSPTNPRAASKQVSLRGDVLGYGKVYMRVPHEKSCSKIRTFAEKQSLSAKKAEQHRNNNNNVTTPTQQQQERKAKRNTHSAAEKKQENKMMTGGSVHEDTEGVRNTLDTCRADDDGGRVTEHDER